MQIEQTEALRSESVNSPARSFGPRGSASPRPKRSLIASGFTPFSVGSFKRSALPYLNDPLEALPPGTTPGPFSFLLPERARNLNSFPAEGAGPGKNPVCRAEALRSGNPQNPEALPSGSRHEQAHAPPGPAEGSAPPRPERFVPETQKEALPFLGHWNEVLPRKEEFKSNLSQSPKRKRFVPSPSPNRSASLQKAFCQRSAVEDRSASPERAFPSEALHRKEEFKSNPSRCPQRKRSSQSHRGGVALA